MKLDEDSDIFYHETTSNQQPKNLQFKKTFETRRHVSFTKVQNYIAMNKI